MIRINESFEIASDQFWKFKVAYYYLWIGETFIVCIIWRPRVVCVMCVVLVILLLFPLCIM